MSKQSKAPDLLDPDMPADQLRLMGGEMTAQEVRTARAFIRAANTKAIDHCNALVGAAIRSTQASMLSSDPEIAFKELTAEDAQAAYDAAISAARAEGYAKGVEDAVRVAEDHKSKDMWEVRDAGAEYCAGVRDVHHAIRALKDQPNE